MKRTIYIIILILGVSLFHTPNLEAQRRSRFSVDGICKQAQSLLLEEGISLIESNLNNCQYSSNEAACRLKLNFTAGYLYQMAASESGENHERQLAKSVEYYQKAHEIDPQNIAVSNNLIVLYMTLGNSDAALSLLDRSLELDPRNASKYFANKGEVYEAMEELKLAIEFYKRAYFIDPSNEALVWKIFNLYNNWGNQEEAFVAISEFADQLFVDGKYDLARSGYLNAIGIALAGAGSEKATDACVRWAEMLAAKNSVNQSYTKELPDLKTWPSECNRELQLLLTNEFSSIHQLSWWGSDDYFRHIAATILLKMEASELMEGEIASAVRLLEAGLEIAPEFYRYDDPRLRNYYPVKMDIAVELSRLYNRYADLDLDRRKYDRLIRQLFNEKSAHYLQNNLEAIQKSHTMLGLIFADRGVWTSDWYAGNAIFQLERAIGFQKQIEESNPEKYKPIPSLYQILAQGYVKTNQQEKVSQTLVDAAVGYLDLDNLTMADSIIRTVENAPEQSAAVKQRLNELTLITSLRLNIREDKFNINSTDIETLERTIGNNELFKNETEVNGQSFVNRQKFKILADLGAKCSEQNPAYQYPTFEIKALNYIDQEKALGNLQDINRLNVLEEKFQKNLDQDSRIQINLGKSRTETGEQMKSWSLNAVGYQSQIIVNRDLFVATKVIEDIKKGRSQISESDLQQIQIRRGEVTIPKDLQEKESIDQSKIRKLNGVSNVRIINELE